MPRKPAWQKDHGHDHVNRCPEHEHGEDPTEESLKLEHDVLFVAFPNVDDNDDFDQGPEANRHPMDPPTDPNAEPPSTEDLTAKGKPSNGQVAQTGFGDHVVNVEDEEGEKFLALLDERSEIKELATRWSAINLDIKKQLSNRGIPAGAALRVRVGAHILNFSDKSEDKEQDAKTRVGSQRLSIVHPDSE